MKKIYLGIDIGGTNIKAVKMENFLRPPASYLSLPTPRTLQEIEKAITALAEKIGRGGGSTALAGIGIGMPGIVNKKSGKIIKAPHVPSLDGWNAVSAMQARFSVPVKIDNDSRLMLVAEAKFGKARGKKNVLGVAIGTGIGGGLMTDGRVAQGAHGAAGEFGHMLVEMAKEREWEELAAKRAFERWGDRSVTIGRGIANLINAFDPEIVVVGGGGAASGKIDFGVVRSEVRRLVLSPDAKRTPVVEAALGERAQAIGAALLFLP
ncbi:MAG: ROK family protein [Patescibacteria group bacterium]